MRLISPISLKVSTGSCHSNENKLRKPHLKWSQKALEGEHLTQVPLSAASITSRKKENKNYFERENITLITWEFHFLSLRKGKKSPPYSSKTPLTDTDSTPGQTTRKGGS